MADKCRECGGEVAERVAPVTHQVGRKEVLVEEDWHLYCASCGTISYRGTMLDESQRKIAAKIRHEEGLLSPDELRAIRLKYGFTQAEMERLLTIGPKTWVRWERGKVVQTSAADQLIRVMARNPEALRDMMQTRGLHSEAAERVLAEIDEKIRVRIEDGLRAKFPEVNPEILREMSAIAAGEVRTALHQKVTGEMAA